MVDGAWRCCRAADAVPLSRSVADTRKSGRSCRSRRRGHAACATRSIAWCWRWSTCAAWPSPCGRCSWSRACDQSHLHSRICAASSAQRRSKRALECCNEMACWVSCWCRCKCTSCRRRSLVLCVLWRAPRWCSCSFAARSRRSCPRRAEEWSGRSRMHTMDAPDRSVSGKSPCRRRRGVQTRLRWLSRNQSGRRLQVSSDVVERLNSDRAVDKVGAEGERRKRMSSPVCVSTLRMLMSRNESQKQARAFYQGLAGSMVGDWALVMRCSLGVGSWERMIKEKGRG